MGALVLIEQYVESWWLGLLFLLALGAMFLLRGSMLRSAGILIPGGMLTSLGLGVALEGWLLGDLSGEAKGGVLLLALALGWVLVFLLSTRFTDELPWWSLIPAGLMAVIGGARLAGGQAREALASVGSSFSRALPVVFIALGLYVVLRRKVE